MKSIVTVSGKDKTGIISSVTSLLSEHSINILDISQTVLQDYFAMIMLVDLTGCDIAFTDLERILSREGKNMCMDVRIMRQEIFNAMHRI